MFWKAKEINKRLEMLECDHHGMAQKYSYRFGRPLTVTCTLCGKVMEKGTREGILEIIEWYNLKGACQINIAKDEL